MMTSRRLLAIATVAVVAIVVMVRVTGRTAPPSRPPATDSATTVYEPGVPELGAEPTTVATSTSTSTPPAEVGPSASQLGEAQTAEAVEAGAVAPAPADQWRALVASDAPRQGVYRLIGDPANSDLPATVATRAAAAGSAFTVADASGVGREAFGDWWGERPPVPVAAEVRVLAAGAASYGRLVQVVVVWDGTAPDGTALGERTSTVLLEPTSSGFVPIHPGDAG